ncbi:uncharacterized protein FIBRA_00346 [Fibroporia radiculosa]|uniref:Uncharacterized protein n=1 Tax=Fibroporia radiculosa TaxID=599839 RepID=J7SC20_9APHY|nr:uncharacterized protein FIBRA_00346 [Fibroporia radiculosa]CCL98351.1 predicted protein [Fibroporia radiculosa]
MRSFLIAPVAIIVLFAVSVLGLPNPRPEINQNSARTNGGALDVLERRFEKPTWASHLLFDPRSIYGRDVSEVRRAVPAGSEALNWNKIGHTVGGIIGEHIKREDPVFARGFEDELRSRVFEDKLIARAAEESEAINWNAVRHGMWRLNEIY